MIPFPIHYRELDAIYARTVSSQNRSIAITCSVPGEGVSTLAYALARRAAAAGKRTLLVDLNTAHPSVAQRLALPANEWSLDNVHDSGACVELGRTGLAVLPAPVTTAQDWSFRDIHSLREWLKSLRDHFDLVVLDTAPLLSFNQRDVPPDAVCAAADATVMVVLTGRTTEGKVLESKEKLHTSNARLIGAVLNDRYAPGLPAEMLRETARIEKTLPGLAAKLRNWIRSSPLLNQSL